MIANAKLLCLAAAFAAGSAGLPLARAESDMLERPSAMSERARSAGMLAVTRAGKRLVAVGERGIVLISDDSGLAWKQARVPVSISLTNVFFATERKGWAVGHSGVLLATTDGGETWSRQLDGSRAAALVLEAAKNDMGAGIDAATAERRVAEAQQLMADGPDKPFLDVYFSSESTGYVVGAYGLIFRTDDGGKNWIPWQDHVDNPERKHLYSIRADGAALYIAGEQGALFRSTDDGAHFGEVKTPYAGSYFGVAAGEGNLLVFGLRGNAYWSGNAGRNWQKVNMDTSSLLAAACYLSDGSLVLIDQDGGIRRSTDGGRNFLPLPVSQRSSFTGVIEAADGSLIVSGTRGTTRLPPITRGTGGKS